MVPTTEKVWEEFNAGLKLFILKRVSDEPGAEDILQDVFHKIHTHIGSLLEYLFLAPCREFNGREKKSSSCFCVTAILSLTTWEELLITNPIVTAV